LFSCNLTCIPSRTPIATLFFCDTLALSQVRCVLVCNTREVYGETPNEGSTTVTHHPMQYVALGPSRSWMVPVSETPPDATCTANRAEDTRTCRFNPNPGKRTLHHDNEGARGRLSQEREALKEELRSLSTRPGPDLIEKANEDLFTRLIYAANLDPRPIRMRELWTVALKCVFLYSRWREGVHGPPRPGAGL
jgi:hypothetical protein